MKVTHQNIKIRDLIKQFKDDGENGVRGYDNQLDIRPPYQREFVYNEKQQQAVIDTVLKGFPLNVMYWGKKPDGSFEIIDGQQRTLSICKYVDSGYGHNDLMFHNLPQDKRDAILDYELTVYVCEGTESEKLEWFKIINIAGEQLTPQELRNAVYAGSWLADAKKHFSRTGCPAYQHAGSYMNGVPIRQDYLETVMAWAADADGLESIEAYMAVHQHDADASAIWSYFRRVIMWVEDHFTEYRKEMKGLPWGLLYNQYKNRNYDPKVLGAQVTALMQDEDVTKKKGIYEYLLSGNAKHLNVRAFSPRQRREAYERQKGVCAECGQYFEFKSMEADHIVPWHAGGKTEASNCQMLCQADNRRKSGK